MVGRAGARLVADVAEVTGLTSACGLALASLRQRQGGHDPGRVAVDVAVMIADGGEAISDLAVLRDQSTLFGLVASDPTAWRLLSTMDSQVLDRLRAARAAARETAWAQVCDTRGGLPETTAAGQPVPGLVLDVDASVVICHSDKEPATPTWKGSFGYHPLFCFLDNTHEALSGILCEGRAGSNTTADHITVLDQALAQIPDHHRHGTPILIRSDSAGCTHGLLAHIRNQRRHGVDARFSVGVAITEPIRQATATMIEQRPDDWIPALDGDGQPRDGAEVCELTGLVPTTATHPEPGSSSAAITRTPVHNCRCSTPSKAYATRSWPPIPHPGPARSSTSKPATAATPASRTASAPARTPASAASRPGPSPSTPPGSNSPSPVSTCSPGPRRSSSTVTWPPPNRRTALPTPTPRRPNHPRRPTHPPPHRRNLALGNQTGSRVHPAHRPAQTRHLNCRHDPASTDGAPRPRAGPSPSPNTDNTPAKIKYPPTHQDHQHRERRRLAAWRPIMTNLTPHGLRHGYQTWMDEAGISYVLQSEQMGHEVPGMRGVYSHMSSRMRAELRAAPQRVWEESLRQRAALPPRPSVAMLDVLLQAAGLPPGASTVGAAPKWFPKLDR